MMEVFGSQIEKSFGYLEVVLDGITFLVDTTSSTAIGKLERMLEERPADLVPVMLKMLRTGGIDALRKFSPAMINQFCKDVRNKDLELLDYAVFVEEVGSKNLCIYNKKQYSIRSDLDDVWYLQFDGDTNCPEQPLNISSMYLMFSDFPDSYLDVSKWDVSAVVDMDYVFWGDYNLTGLNLHEWDIGNVISLENAFRECRNLRDLDLSSWKLKPTCSTEGMFLCCDSLVTTNNKEVDRILEEMRR